MMFRCKISFIFFYCFMLFNVAMASSMDNLKITSDNLVIEKNKSTATFTGIVTVIFEDIKVLTSEIIVFYNDIEGNKKIKHIIIPHKLKAIKSCTNEIIIADRAIFNNSTNKLTLEGNVHLQKEDNILMTNKLIYSTSL